MRKKYFATKHLHDSIVVSIPACHAGDRGSIPRRGVCFWIPFLPQFTKVIVENLDFLLFGLFGTIYIFCDSYLFLYLYFLLFINTFIYAIFW